MNKSRKVDLLYKKAKGQNFNATPAEKQELMKYRVRAGEDDFYTTIANISAYVTAVDNGNRSSFYDWCMNHGRADRRRKGSSAKAISSLNTERSIGMIFVGWLTWGMAIYWMFHGSLDVKTCAIGGIIISFLISRFGRRWAGLTVFLLPIILTAVFGQ